MQLQITQFVVFQSESKKTSDYKKYGMFPLEWHNFSIPIVVINI